MKAAVIDTNVLLVANGKHANTSLECQKVCIKRLQAHQLDGVVVIDDAYRILSEYLYKTRPNQPKGVGDVFLKWLLQNAGDSKRVHRVAITETGAYEYTEFPDAALQPVFDPRDRIFAAVAHGHSDAPPVWQATDCKWLIWWQQLAACGIHVDFLCPDDVVRFYGKKFPGQAVPYLPS